MLKTPTFIVLLAFTSGCDIGDARDGASTREDSAVRIAKLLEEMPDWQGSGGWNPKKREDRFRRIMEVFQTIDSYDTATIRAGIVCYKGTEDYQLGIPQHGKLYALNKFLFKWPAVAPDLKYPVRPGHAPNSEEASSWPFEVKDGKLFLTGTSHGYYAGPEYHALEAFDECLREYGRRNPAPDKTK